MLQCVVQYMDGTGEILGSETVPNLDDAKVKAKRYLAQFCTCVYELRFVAILQGSEIVFAYKSTQDAIRQIQPNQIPGFEMEV